MRVLLVGDSHGDVRFIEKMLNMANRKNCSRIVVLGDFGYWPHTSFGRYFLDTIIGWSVEWEIPIYWIDGNHENHDMLITEKVEADGGFIMIRENVLYIPRGHKFSWDNVDFLGIGGAWSIDKMGRTPGVSWWAGETITDVDVERASSVGKIDVIFSHDSPASVPVPGILFLPESEENRERLKRIVQATRPDFLFHGHYHVNYEFRASFLYEDEDGNGNWHDVNVHGLAHNESPGVNSWQAWKVLDTNEIRRS